MSYSNYTIYNASAGSGKTYGLVKSYLKIVLNTKNSDTFKHLLAITFTNKAVYEMKERIVKYLIIFTKDEMMTSPDSMFSQLQEELKIAPVELQNRAKKVLQNILHNYAAFSVTTIDGFNHRLIRNFAFDLRLNQRFEISLDTDLLLEKAVDQLLQKAGEDEEITKWLTDFSKEKIEDDKNWDTTSELLEVSKMVSQENHYLHLLELQTKRLEDFKRLKKNLQEKIRKCKNTINNNTKKFIELSENENLTEKEFNRGSVYKFFHKLYQNPNDEPYSWEASWQISITEIPLYTKSYKGDKREVIDQWQPQIAEWFFNIKKAFSLQKIYKNISNNITPLALLNQIQNELEIIKSEENIIPIYEFNSLIFNEIISQPAPFIYERIGERYQHYFIDEFQDTSELQWKNLIPLTLNAIQSETEEKNRGSLLLVGDAKQSIYRWRGGKAEQFMDLYLNEENPFFITPEVRDLEENYRSLPEIINFNNSFFNFISSLFESEKYAGLYEASSQNFPPHKIGKTLQGYVNIQFLDLEILNNQTDEENPIDKDELYCEAVYQAIEDAKNTGAAYSDICVLVRKNSQGAQVAAYLSEKKIGVISPDSLLLQHIPSVQFLVAFMRVLLYPESKEAKADFLFLYAKIKEIEELDSFMSSHINKPIQVLYEKHHFSESRFYSYSLYEGISYTIQCFDIAKDSDAYLSHFQDLIFDFKNGRRGGISDFLNYWDDNKEKLSISSPDGLNAVSIMTVHRSKGLSAPIIIFAFANSKLIRNEWKDKLWIPVESSEFEGFKEVLVNNKKDIANYSEEAKKCLIEYQEQQLLDSVNVLYVAMTRPESMLYVISELPSRNTETYGSVFQSFIYSKQLWEDNKFSYEFGEKLFPKNLNQNQNDEKEKYLKYQIGNTTPTYNIVTRSGMLWDTLTEKSIAKGNLLHELLGKIQYSDEIEKTLLSSVNEGIINEEQQQILLPKLKQVIFHPSLENYYKKPYKIFNEREILSAEGFFLRPDRFVYNPETNDAIVIDYKTGQPSSSHKKQVNDYSDLLGELGWNVKKHILVYINEIIKIVEW